jgi:hypothetical protein
MSLIRRSHCTCFDLLPLAQRMLIHFKLHTLLLHVTIYVTEYIGCRLPTPTTLMETCLTMS